MVGEELQQDLDLKIKPCYSSKVIEGEPPIISIMKTFILVLTLGTILLGVIDTVPSQSDIQTITTTTLEG